MARAAVLSVATPWYQPWQPTEVRCQLLRHITWPPPCRRHCRGSFRVPRPAVLCRGCLPWVAVEIAMEIAVDLAVEIAVEIVMASAMGVHGVPLIAAAFRASPWNVRGSPWSVRGSPWSVHGCPWNAVEKDVERRGGPWALPRCSVKKINNVHPSLWAPLKYRAICRPVMYIDTYPCIHHR